MFKSLFKVRIAALINSLFSRTTLSNKKGGSAGGKIVVALLFAYVVVVFAGMFITLFYTLASAFHAAGLDWLYGAAAGLVAAALCLVGSVFTAQSQLYNASDNELLLSMPVTSAAILASRMATLLLINYAYEAVVVLPAAAVWLICGLPVSVGSVICSVVGFIILPLMPLTLSCILGGLIEAATVRMKNKNIVSLVFSLALMGIYFYFCFNAENAVTALVADIAGLVDKFSGVLTPLCWLGRASSDGNAGLLILFVLSCIVPFAIMYYILSKSFIGIATQKRGDASVKLHKPAKDRVRGAFMAIVNKEIRRFESSSTYMLNAGLGLVMMIAATVLLVVKRESAVMLLAAFGEENMVLAIGTALLAIGSIVIISAPSISLEGKELWILQSLPICGSTVLRAKAFAHIAIAAPVAAVCAAAAGVILNFSLVQTVCLVLLALDFTAFTAYFGVLINLRFHRFDWISEATVIKSSVPIVIAMFGSMVLAILPAGVYALFVYDKLSSTAYLFICAAAFAAAAAAMDAYIQKHGGERYAALV